MIRLFASDVDGTLLPTGKRELDPSITASIRRTLDRGIKGAIASGRSRASLERLFGSASGELYFISYDGALCTQGKKTIFSRPIDKESLSVFFAYAKATLIDAVFCGSESCYSVGGSAARLFERDGEKVEAVLSIYDIKEPIYKISVLGGAEALRGETRTRRIDGSSAWSEFVSADVNKGTALSYLQLKLGMSAFDTAVIGNGEGDIPMLKHASLRAKLPDASEKYSAAAVELFGDAKEFFDLLVTRG